MSGEEAIADLHPASDARPRRTHRRLHDPLDFEVLPGRRDRRPLSCASRIPRGVRLVNLLGDSDGALVVDEAHHARSGR